MSNSNDITTGSRNYNLLTDTAYTAPGAGPSVVGNLYNSAASEADVWTFNTATDVLSAQWINTNLTSPNTIEVYLATSNALLNTGDLTAFNATFGVGVPINYVFVGSDTPSAPASVTPEPSSLILLGTGVLGAFGVARRRFNA